MARDTLLFDETRVSTSAEVLKRAYSIIEDRKNWCQGAIARPAGGGKSLAFNNADARQFCGIAAILKAEEVLGRTPGTLVPVHSAMGHLVTFVNDTFGHKAMLWLLRFMIRFGN